MNILSILNELASTSSTNEKEAILRREKDNELLKRVFQAAYNPLIVYGIKQIPEYSTLFSNPIPLKFAIEDLLNNLANRKLTGNAAIQFLGETLSEMVKDDAIVLERIIQRDLRCGTSDSLASRVWPNLVPEFDVMLCGKDITKIKFPAYSQLKCDGARVSVFYDGINVKAVSRAGKEFHLLGRFDEAAKQFMKEGEEFDGELLVVDAVGKVVDRQTGNGILNKCNKGTISEAEADRIIMVVWDIVDRSSTITYNLRLQELERRHLTGKFKLVPSKLVATQEDAMEHFAELLSKGEEGTIVKNFLGKWVGKRSNDNCKLKAIETADLRVIGVEEGTGKYTGMVGALVCETSDSLLRVNVGTGLKDEDRAKPLQEYLGKVVEVLYNAKIKSKGKDKASLFLPRFVSVRWDKDVANTLEEIK